MMLRQLRNNIFLSGILMLSADPLWADAEQAKKIMLEASNKVMAIESLKLLEATVSSNEKESLIINKEVTLVRSEDKESLRQLLIDFTAKTGPREQRMTAVLDGEMFQILEFESKVNLIGDSNDEEFVKPMVNRLLQLHMSPFYHRGELPKEAEGVVFDTKRDRKVSGELCNVVTIKITSPDGEYKEKQTLYFDVDEGFLRKSKIRIESGDGRSQTTSSQFDVKVAPEVESDYFALNVPGDFETKFIADEAKKKRAEEEARLANTLKVGEIAPEWELKDSQGKLHRLSDYRGQIVVMDFWATWCGPCKRSMPEVQKLHDDFAEKGLKVFGVNTSEYDGPDAAVEYMSEEGFTYDLLLEADAVAGLYGVDSLPTFVIIDREGNIASFGNHFDRALIQNMVN